MSGGLCVRPCLEADEPAVRRLFAHCFGRELPEAALRWKRLAPGHRPDDAWVAVAPSGRVVGHWAGIPVRLRLGGRVLDARVGVDGMTAPEERRRGVQAALQAASAEAWRRAGAAVVLGLPNQQWGDVLARAGWRPAFELPWRRRLARLDLALMRALLPVPSMAEGRARRGTGVTVGVGASSADLDVVWQRAAGAAGALVVRDAAWLAWRFLRSPVVYRLLLARDAAGPVGYAVLRTGGRRAVLADLLAPHERPEVAGELLDGARAAAGRAGAVSLRALAPPGSAAERALDRAGFGAAPGAFRLWALPLEEGLGPLPASPGWLLAPGDFDVV